MKLTLKNLKQAKYNVELESEKNTIKDLKNEIEKVHGFDSNVIKLLLNGKVLEDSKTLEDYQIKSENIIIMMNTKPKPKEQNVEPKKEEQQQKKEEEQQKKEEENQKKEEENQKKEEEKPKKEEKEPKKEEEQSKKEEENPKKEEEQTKKEEDSQKEKEQENKPNSTGNNENKENIRLPMELRRYASMIKVLCRDEPEKIFDILDNLKARNPALLNKIKEHEEEFKSLLVSPINQQDLDFYKLMEEDVKALSIGGFSQERGGEEGRGEIKIHLSPEELQAVNRLKELGDFNENEIVQAYFACDKNEELAANYLFEERMREEEEEQYMENNNNDGEENNGE